MLLQQQGDLTAALADFDRALALDPAHAATYVARGQARKEVGDLQGARADFDRAVEHAAPPQLAAAYHGRGGVRVLENDFVGALADYDRALALAPGQFHLHLSRGNARYHRRDPRGLLDFREAFRLDPDGAARELVRTLAADARRGAGSVLENCDKHLRLNDGDVLAYARRGLTLVLLGREEEAAPDLARAGGVVPDMLPHLRRVLDLARACRAEATTAGAAGRPAAPDERLRDAVFIGYQKA
jgi:tetratricopeptide (TPR) repeat protein